jgi:hypothetical protein
VDCTAHRLHSAGSCSICGRSRTYRRSRKPLRSRKLKKVGTKGEQPSGCFYLVLFPFCLPFQPAGHPNLSGQKLRRRGSRSRGKKLFCLTLSLQKTFCADSLDRLPMRVFRSPRQKGKNNPLWDINRFGRQKSQIQSRKQND